MDTRPSMESFHRAFGVDVVVSVPWKADVATRGFWLPEDMNELPAGGGQQRRAPRKVMVLSKSDVPELPREALIQAPEQRGGTTKTWKVDTIEHSDTDHVRAVLLEKELFP